MIVCTINKYIGNLAFMDYTKYGFQRTPRLGSDTKIEKYDSVN